MKPLSVLLSSAVVVIAAIVVYDQVVRPPAAPARPDAPGELERRASEPGADAPRMLTARRTDRDRRLANLETAIEDLRAEVARLAEGAEAAADGGGDSPRSADDPLDEGKLAALRLQMEELTRRKEARRQSMMVKRKLEGLGLALSEGEHAAVMDRMVKFHVAVTELWSRVREEAIADQELIADEYTLLTDEAAKDVRRLLAADKAAAIVKGFLTVGPPGHRPPR